MGKSVNIDLGSIKKFIADQPKYVLYGSGLIFLGVLLLVLGLFML